MSVKERESEEIRCGDVVDHSWRKAPESLVASRQDFKAETHQRLMFKIHRVLGSIHNVFTDCSFRSLSILSYLDKVLGSYSLA